MCIDTPAENILTEFIVLGIHALEMDEELVFFVVLDEGKVKGATLNPF